MVFRRNQLRLMRNAGWIEIKRSLLKRSVSIYLKPSQAQDDLAIINGKVFKSIILG